MHVFTHLPPITAVVRGDNLMHHILKFSYNYVGGGGSTWIYIFKFAANYVNATRYREYWGKCAEGGVEVRHIVAPYSVVKFPEVTSWPPSSDVTSGNFASPTSIIELSFFYYSILGT